MIVVPNWHYIIKDNFFDNYTHELLLHRFNQIKENVHIADDEQFYAIYTHQFNNDAKQNSQTLEMINAPIMTIRSLGKSMKVYDNKELETKLIDTLNHLRKNSETDINNAYSYLTSSLENQKQIIGCSYSLAITGKHFEYLEHTDLPEKALSTIVYVGENNLGTFLSRMHSSDSIRKERKILESEEILWKSNRGFIFCGKGRPSFKDDDKLVHYYKSNGKSPRCTVGINLLSGD